MRQPTAAVAVAAICTLMVGCATTRGYATLPATPTMIPRPLFERELPGLLLRPEQVDAAMGAFFDSSAQQWPACRHYTHAERDRVTAGEISNTNDTLSTVATLHDAAAPGWSCGRALALRNNVIVDVNTRSASPADSAVRIESNRGQCDCVGSSHHGAISPASTSVLTPSAS